MLTPSSKPRVRTSIAWRSGTRRSSLVPKPTTDSSRPLRPSLRYSIAPKLRLGRAVALARLWPPARRETAGKRTAGGGEQRRRSLEQVLVVLRRQLVLVNGLLVLADGVLVLLDELLVVADRVLVLLDG